MCRFTSVLCLAVLFSCASLAVADIPKLINYQGMLTDGSGTPLNGSFNIDFEIYNASSGGALRWGEPQSAVSVTNGLFNVTLGSVNPLNLDFSENYWMEIIVEGQMMPERLRFTSVGYAYRAEKADTADYALSSPSGPGGYTWTFRITDTADTTITTGGCWGITRYGNTLYGNKDSTHVNLGLACTTGTSGQNDQYCTVAGGWGSKASGFGATVGGGVRNTASEWGPTVGGGWDNTASDDFATVGGGQDNTADYDYATVGGGQYNTAVNFHAAVGGGYSNLASGNCATVGGGCYDTASNAGATVGGGLKNTASGLYATVAGGRLNTASGDYSFATGYRAKALHAGSFVWADTAEADFSSTGADQFLIRASGGVGIGTPSPESQLHVLHNDASGNASLILENLHPTGHARISFRPNSIEQGYIYANVNGATVYNTSGGGMYFRSNGADKMLIKDNGNVGIGTTDPQGYKLFVDGSAAKPGGGNWDTPSDIRLKKVNGVYECGLSEISQLMPTHYTYREGNELGLPTEREYVGLVAQDVRNVIPDAVSENEQGYLMLNSDPIIWAMLNAIKELKTENEELKRRIEVLEDR